MTSGCDPECAGIPVGEFRRSPTRWRGCRRSEAIHRVAIIRGNDWRRGGTRPYHHYFGSSSLTSAFHSFSPIAAGPFPSARPFAAQVFFQEMLDLVVKVGPGRQSVKAVPFLFLDDQLELLASFLKPLGQFPGLLDIHLRITAAISQ